MRRLSLFLTLALASGLSAQREPQRPRLSARADTNDAEEYFALGARQHRDVWKAHDAFYWAFRLQPDQPIYLYARYFALLNRQPADWQQNYWGGAAFVLKSRDAKLIDSTFGEVMLRDPFIHLTLDCRRYPELDRELDRAAAGFAQFALGCYQAAALAFGEALVRDPGDLTVRMMRALAYSYVGIFDSTTVDLRIVVDSLHARDAERLVHAYESKAMLEYVAGMAHLRRGDAAAARAAFGRALTEDLGFGMAHGRLARLTRDRGNPMAALPEYDLAVGLRPEDGVLRHDYGATLHDLGRYADAEAQLREAVRIEPYWAAPRFSLAAALQAQGKTQEAAEQFEAYLARCPRALELQAAEARRRLERLRTAGSTP
jgi:Tfp pilus assembly protein PilF